ncbi:hypothetical protein F53441_1673 [Fusarium austroafricanum]|uniref:Uncharacterized protein n=1 Tax=Fusarium austroafricanum TaxID=2364996 RepID=A0A8H4KVL9_9HYPO|nr:hypothetical protein F53441_1673 [Fusarium austroafricanum]
MPANNKQAKKGRDRRNQRPSPYMPPRGEQQRRRGPKNNGPLMQPVPRSTITRVADITGNIEEKFTIGDGDTANPPNWFSPYGQGYMGEVTNGDLNKFRDRIQHDTGMEGTMFILLPKNPARFNAVYENHTQIYTSDNGWRGPDGKPARFMPQTRTLPGHGKQTVATKKEPEAKDTGARIKQESFSP